MSETVDHSDITIEATRSNTSGVWVKDSSAYSWRRAGATYDDEKVPAHELVVLVKWEGLYNNG